MDPLQLSILCLAALATSMLSAVVGMAGGITLLSVMLLFMEPLVAIPLHGVVQLVSNGSRTVIQVGSFAVQQVMPLHITPVLADSNRVTA